MKNPENRAITIAKGTRYLELTKYKSIDNVYVKTKRYNGITFFQSLEAINIPTNPSVPRNRNVINGKPRIGIFS